jgi:hypothetical protein
MKKCLSIEISLIQVVIELLHADEYVPNLIGNIERKHRYALKNNIIFLIRSPEITCLLHLPTDVRGSVCYSLIPSSISFSLRL